MYVFKTVMGHFFLSIVNIFKVLYTIFLWEKEKNISDKNSRSNPQSKMLIFKGKFFSFRNKKNNNLF